MDYGMHTVGKITYSQSSYKGIAPCFVMFYQKA